MCTSKGCLYQNHLSAPKVPHNADLFSRKNGPLSCSGPEMKQMYAHKATHTNNDRGWFATYRVMNFTWGTGAIAKTATDFASVSWSGRIRYVRCHPQKLWTEHSFQFLGARRGGIFRPYSRYSHPKADRARRVFGQEPVDRSFAFSFIACFSHSTVGHASTDPIPRRGRRGVEYRVHHRWCRRRALSDGTVFGLVTALPARGTRAHTYRLPDR